MGDEFLTRMTTTLLQKSGFALIDLRFQYWAVLNYTTGWSQEEILTWMQLFGEVGSLTTEMFGTNYGFKSQFGLMAAFRFEPDGRLIVIQGRRKPVD
jgi:hypothetical protein